MHRTAFLGLLGLLVASPALAGPDGAAGDAAPVAVPARPAPPAEPAPVSRGATITVGSVVNGTSNGIIVGPPEIVRGLAVERLAASGLPAVAPSSQSGAEIDAGDARFVLNGLVTGQACTRIPDWSGCRWRIRWDIYDRRARTVVWRASAVGEASVRQSTATSGMYHDILLDSLGVVATDPSLAQRLAEADPDAAPEPPKWDAPLDLRLCPAAPTVIGDLKGSFVRVEGPTEGTATLISPDGFALTAARLVAGVDRVPVVLADGRSATARVVRVDEISDLALIDLEGTDHRCVPPSRKAAAVGDPAISVIAGPDGMATAAGGLTAVNEISGIWALDASAAPYAVGPGGAVLDDKSHLLGVRVRPLDADEDKVVPTAAVPVRLGLRAGERSTADLASVQRAPANTTVGVGPVSTEEPPLLAPRPPARTRVRIDEVPGATETALGAAMLSVGGSVALIAGAYWAGRESNPWDNRPDRAALATTTIVGAGVAVGGGILMAIGYDEQRKGKRVELTAGPSSVGVRGRF